MVIDMDMKIEHWKKKAEIFLENKIKCFIKTIDRNYHSADILFIGENKIQIYDFIKKREFKIYWVDIVLFDEFRRGNNGISKM